MLNLQLRYISDLHNRMLPFFSISPKKTLNLGKLLLLNFVYIKNVFHRLVVQCKCYKMMVTKWEIEIVNFSIVNVVANFMTTKMRSNFPVRFSSTSDVGVSRSFIIQRLFVEMCFNRMLGLFWVTRVTQSLKRVIEIYK